MTYDCYKCSVRPEALMAAVGGCFTEPEWLCKECGSHCLKSYNHTIPCSTKIPVEHKDGTTGDLISFIDQWEAVVIWHNHSKKSPRVDPRNLKVRLP